MIRKDSSYDKNNFQEIFDGLVKEIKPKLIVEFGIGNGYSTTAFAKSANCPIHANDIFDEFPFNRADYSQICELFKDNPHINIRKRNFYESSHIYKDGEIDILHIDIANDGDVYEFAVNKFFPKVSQSGIMILEGGSKERDEVYWMRQFNKKPIMPYLSAISDKYIINTIQKYPSLTIIKRK